ncbi:MAG: hypothetical protein KIH69_022815 [Anaerolineae bacterium]|nr:hypothetical protein [Anaerolineae bacterium]
MSVESLILALDGEISLENFAQAIDGFLGVVRTLATEIMPSQPFDWVIDDLEYGSAIVSVRPSQTLVPNELTTLGKRYLMLGYALNSGNQGQLSPAIFKAGQRLLSVVSTGIRFETSDDEVIIKPYKNEVNMPVYPQARHSFGVVRGTVQTLSRRKGVRFILYDVMFDKPVSCYLTTGQEDMVKNYWGCRVSVSGQISRDGLTGVPLSIRNITNISSSEPSEPGSWRKAKGVLKNVFDTSSERVIRELRDA